MIVTDGGRFGGYGLFLSGGFNWWFHERLFIRIGLAAFILGVLLIWLGQYENGRGENAAGLWAIVLGLAVGGCGVCYWRNWPGRGKPVFLYNLLDLKRTTWAGPSLSVGKHTIVFDFKSDGPGLGKGGTGVLSVDGKEVARNSVDHTTPITFPEDEGFDIGQDTRTGIAMLEYRYDVPFKFTGTIDKLTFSLGEQQLTAEERKQLPAIADAVARARD